MIPWLLLVMLSTPAVAFAATKADEPQQVVIGALVTIASQFVGFLAIRGELAATKKDIAALKKDVLVLQQAHGGVLE
jgi:heme O synthase-like polyprenyltransferase